ncbi:Scr1 family TA system antitoxin-like transcriptional regulator [Umezawaea endophytica]|uniref:Scr1 family TA system antitoxin-like transcriptional regulator n=1 Tax=Umezawaea endophytica TaxID=1654476 RepID=A0A9X2VNA4_9PSEU|nr:Scr1 family TA system antitoxin-like transcriptional regulator [Umezawaea endophytica]MCS7479838.1 Scr1 family TA system antitoxin-like transcriptional regulator [Umezawaea endophytica]
MPTSRRHTAGLAGSFTFMRFTGIPPVVFVETENSSLFVEDKAPVTGYRTVLDSLASVALDEEQSRELISTIAT